MPAAGMTNLKQPMLALGDTRPMLGSDKLKLVICIL